MAGLRLSTGPESRAFPMEPVRSYLSRGWRMQSIVRDFTHFVGGRSTTNWHHGRACPTALGGGRGILASGRPCARGRRRHHKARASLVAGLSTRGRATIASPPRQPRRNGPVRACAGGRRQTRKTRARAMARPLLRGRLDGHLRGPILREARSRACEWPQAARKVTGPAHGPSGRAGGRDTHRPGWRRERARSRTRGWTLAFRDRCGPHLWPAFSRAGVGNGGLPGMGPVKDPAGS